MNERRLLFGIAKEDIPSSAKVLSSSNYSSFTGYNVIYVPIYINNSLYYRGYQFTYVPYPSNSGAQYDTKLWINDIEYLLFDWNTEAFWGYFSSCYSGTGILVNHGVISENPVVRGLSIYNNEISKAFPIYCEAMSNNSGDYTLLASTAALNYRYVKIKFSKFSTSKILFFSADSSLMFYIDLEA